MLIGIVGLYILGQIEISIKWEAGLAFWMYSSFAGHCLTESACSSLAAVRTWRRTRRTDGRWRCRKEDVLMKFYVYPPLI